jgi:hypothetical protein
MEKSKDRSLRQLLGFMFVRQLPDGRDSLELPQAAIF